MRVAHILDSSKVGGIETFVQETVAAQINLGFDVRVFILEEQAESESLAFQNSTVLCIKKPTISLFGQPENIELLEACLLEFRPEIIHTHKTEADIAVIQCKLNFDFSLVSQIHDYSPIFRKGSISQIHSFKIELGRRLFFQRSKTRKVRYLVGSNHLKEKCLSSFPSWASNKIHLIDLYARVQHLQSSRQGLINYNSPRFLTIGRLTKKKNVVASIKLISSMVSAGLNPVLRIHGIGEEEASLRDLVKQKQLDDFVVFSSVVDDVTHLYDSYDILLHPSHYEGFGLVVVEAMARGMPCIANSGLPSVNYILGDGRFGILCDVEDIATFSGEAIKLTSDSERFASFSQAGLERSRYFSSARYLNDLSNLYRVARS